MTFLLSKFGLILFLAICLRFIEHCREIISSNNSNCRWLNIRALYNILYLHLPMAMAAVGLVCDKLYWSGNNTGIPLLILIVIIMALIGSICRGILSQGEPEVFSIFDRDWTLGIIIPNILGLSALLLALWQI